MFKVRKISILVCAILFNSLYIHTQKVIFPFKAKNGKWGYCDTERKTVVKPTLTYADLHHNGMAKVINEEDQQALINDKGEYVIPFGDYIVSTAKNESVFSSIQSMNYKTNTNAKHYDNVFVVIKDKVRDWYNAKGDKLYSDDFSSKLTLLNYNTYGKNQEVFYVLTNEDDDHITVISSSGKLLVKEVENGYKASTIEVFVDEGKKETYVKVYKGKKKEKDNSGYGTESIYNNYESDYNYNYDKYNYDSYLYNDREEVKCQFMTSSGEIIIPFSRGLLDVHKSSTYYSVFAGDQSYVFIDEMVHESADCEPKKQTGFYSIMSKREVIRPAFDGSSFYGPVYDQSSYDGYTYVSEEDKEMLNIINSNKKFKNFQELSQQVESVKDKIRNANATVDDEEVSENPVKGVFLVFNNENKTLVYKQTGKDFELYKQVDGSFSFSGMFFKNDELYANIQSDYNSVYNLTTGNKESKYAADDKKLLLEGAKYKVVTAESGRYNLEDKKGNKVLKDDFESYVFYNEQKKMLQLFNGTMYAIVNLDKGGEVDFIYHDVVAPYKNYGDLEYELYEDALNEPTGVTTENDKKTKYNYPQIVVTDNGFGAINELGELIIPIQDNVLVFEDFGNKKLIGVYKLLASVIKDKKNIGYYNLAGKPFFE